MFLNELDDRWIEGDKIALIASDITYETGAVIHAMPFRAGSYNERTPLMSEVRENGQDIMKAV